MKNNNKAKPHLGLKLKAEMDRLGLKHPAIAAAFGVAVPSVYDWIKDGRIDKKHYGKLVEFFGRPLEWWFDLEPSGGLTARDSGGAVHLRSDEAKLLDLYNFMSEPQRQKLLAGLETTQKELEQMVEEIMRRRQSSTVKG